MKSVFSATLVLIFSQCGWAQSSSTQNIQSTGQLREVINQQKMADPQLITDKKLQADEGSLSRYSMRFGLTYAGPGLGDLENKNQPNYDGVVSSNETKITGSISARYRIDNRSAVGIATSVSAIYPMHGWDRTDLNDPYISYDRSSRFGDLQMRNIFQVGAVTNPVYVKVGEFAFASYEIDLVHRLGDSRFSAGFDTKIDYYFYDRAFDSSKDRGAAQYYVSLYPNLKYEMSDKLNINTSLSYKHYNARSEADRYKLYTRTLTQKVGIGYSYQRSVYFSPYITIYPDNARLKNTTFNLSATFSML